MNRASQHVAAALCSLLMLVQVLAPAAHAIWIDHGDADCPTVSAHTVEAPDHDHHPADCPLCHFLTEGRASAMTEATTALSHFIAVDLSVPPPVLAVCLIQVPREVGSRAPPR